jgi:hypothetical protein
MKSSSRFLSLSALVVFVMAVSLSSCKKKQDEMDPDPDLTTEKDLSNADADMNSIISDIDKAVGQSQINGRLDGTSTFTITGPVDTTVGTFNEYFLLTYTGTGDDGLSRSGKIILYFKNGHARALGNYEDSAVFSATKVDGRSIEGWKWTKQVTPDNSSSWKFQIYASGKIANASGILMNYTSSRTRVRTFYNGTSASLSDTWTITGAWTGTNSKAESVSATITSPIVIDGTCNFRRPVSGKIDFTNNTEQITRSIDYGNGNCDQLAVFTNAKGKQFQIIIR